MNFRGKILLVDDEAHIRKYLALILKTLGQPVLIEAANGEEAVAAFQREQPDLVLLDVNMPILDGLGALAQLMALDPECIVVMLTSLSNRETVEQALALGAVDYIRKDTPKEEIARALAETLAAHFDQEESAP
jgi:two-component system chemotaxis response regulator CheY